MLKFTPNRLSLTVSYLRFQPIQDVSLFVYLFHLVFWSLTVCLNPNLSHFQHCLAQITYILFVLSVSAICTLLLYTPCYACTTSMSPGPIFLLLQSFDFNNTAKIDSSLVHLFSSGSCVVNFSITSAAANWIFEILIVIFYMLADVVHKSLYKWYWGEKLWSTSFSFQASVLWSQSLQDDSATFTIIPSTESRQIGAGNTPDRAS